MQSSKGVGGWAVAGFNGSYHYIFADTIISDIQLHTDHARAR